VYNNSDHYRYDELFNFNTTPSRSIEPTPHIYSPKETAYAVGFDTRYFAEKRNNALSYAVEINQQQFTTAGKVGGIDNGLYSLVSVNWKLTGTLGAIEKHNQLEIFMASKVVPSIVFAIKNFTEFSRITQASVNQYTSTALPVIEDLPNITTYKQAIGRVYTAEQFLSGSV
jgi:hypothetical protein